MNFLSPVAPACRSDRCPRPCCSFGFQRSWGFGFGFFQLSGSKCSQCHFCPSNTANLFSADKTHGTPALGKGDPRGQCWPLVGHTRGDGTSSTLPWAPMAFKALFHQNFLMKEQICHSEGVVDTRSAMNWDFLQQTSIARRQFGGCFSLPYNPVTVQDLVASHASKKQPSVPVSPIYLGACFHYLIKTFSSFSAE